MVTLGSVTILNKEPMVSYPPSPKKEKMDNTIKLLKTSITWVLDIYNQPDVLREK